MVSCTVMNKKTSFALFLFIVSVLILSLCYFKILDCNIFNEDKIIKVNNEDITDDKKNITGYTNLGFGYAKDITKIYFNKKRIHIADYDSFKVLIDGYAKDKNHVYFNGIVINEADLDTFETIDDSEDTNGEKDGYAKDKNYTYLDGKIITGLDPNEIEIIKYPYSKSKTKIFYKSNEIIGIEYDNFSILEDYKIPYFYEKNPRKYGKKTEKTISRHMYAKDSKNIFYRSKKMLADLNSFKIIQYPYSADRSQVFYHNETIKNANPNNFKIIEEKGNKISGFAISNNHVFRYNKILPNILPNDFKKLDYPYFRSNDNIYYKLELIKDADIETFEIFRYPYASDKNNIYFMNNAIKDVNVDTFEILEYPYSKDRFHVYKNEKIDPTKKPSDFLTYPYAKIDDKIYYKIKEIENVDFESFEVIRKPYSKDKNNVYNKTEKIKGQNPDTFKFDYEIEEEKAKKENDDENTENETKKPKLRNPINKTETSPELNSIDDFDNLVIE